MAAGSLSEKAHLSFPHCGPALTVSAFTLIQEHVAYDMKFELGDLTEVGPWGRELVNLWEFTANKERRRRGVRTAYIHLSLSRPSFGAGPARKIPVKNFLTTLLILFLLYSEDFFSPQKKWVYFSTIFIFFPPFLSVFTLILHRL